MNYKFLAVLSIALITFLQGEYNRFAGNLHASPPLAQDCSTGRCNSRNKPTLAPVLPRVAQVTHSIIEAQPVRKTVNVAANVVVGSAVVVNRVAVQPVVRVSYGAVRFACRCCCHR